MMIDKYWHLFFFFDLNVSSVRIVFSNRMTTFVQHNTIHVFYFVAKIRTYTYIFQFWNRIKKFKQLTLHFTSDMESRRILSFCLPIYFPQSTLTFRIHDISRSIVFQSEPSRVKSYLWTTYFAGNIIFRPW